MGDGDTNNNLHPEVHAVDPPAGQPEREGWSSHRGYVYQVWYAIRQWLALIPNEILYLEHAEDTAKTTIDGIEMAQVRQVAAPISLNTAAARTALSNFWKHDSANKRKVSFQYITTGAVTHERGNPFGAEDTGIAVWGKGKTDLAAASRIHDFLKANPDNLSRELVDFLSNSTTEDVQARLIKPFAWNAGFLALEHLRAEVTNELFTFAAKLSPPLRLAKDDLATLSAVLFADATTASVTKDLRKLDQMQLVDLIDRTIYFKTPLRRYSTQQIPPTQQIIESLGSAAIIDWVEPSKELENWPQTLSNGHAIERAEFALIEKRMLESTKSAQLILGEPGSGKSALLAKLSSSLSARGIRHLSIKADSIPKTIKSLDELVKNLGDRSLIDAIREVAAGEKFVVLVDQLDALCSLVDIQTDRLNLLLACVQRLGDLPRIHIVASCRPFEYQTDTRLQTLHAQDITLTLPPWETIAPLVLDENNSPANVPESLKEVLRVPWQLKLFLDLPQPRPLLTSPYDLLTHIWTKKVLRAEAPPGCTEVVELVAKRINKSEEFWIPEAAVGQHPRETAYLISEGILKQTDDLRSIGFRHQTFYDYFLLRTFLREDTTLVDYVKNRDRQSFFIRPTFVQALTYLRMTSRQDYVATITDFLQGDYLRIHLRTLLLEFIGQQTTPFLEEQQLVLPLLKDDKHGQTVLRVVAGSPGWFKAIVGTDFEQRWMARGWSHAVHTVGFLTSALPFAEPTVVDFIANQWLDKPDHDRLAFNILGAAKVWQGRLVDCVRKYTERRSLDEMTWLLREFIKTNPTVGSEVFGTLLAKEAAKFAQQEKEAPAPDPSNAAHAYPDKGPVAKAIKELLHGKNFIRLGIQKMAEAAPEVFLERIWPPIREMLLLAGIDFPRVDPTCYPRDYVELKLHDNGERTDDLLWAIQAGLKVLARTDSASFLTWVSKEAGIDFLPIHRLIARGMLELDAKQADEVMKYLLADRRRLNLGHQRDETAETTALLKKIAGLCSRRFFIKLEKQVASLPATDFARWKKSRPESTRSQVRRVTRLERYELLSSLPLRRIGERRRTLLRQERHRYGGVAERLRSGLHVVSFGDGGLSLNELEALDDSAIIEIVSRADDRIDQNPQHGRSKDRVSSMVFGMFAATHPQRALLQVSHLKPGVHERYAAQLVAKLADPRAPNTNGDRKQFPPVIPGAEIETLARDFHSKGFSTPFFREVVAFALENLCYSQAGLGENTIRMLLGWLSEAEGQPEDPEAADDKEPKDPDSSILWSGSTLLSRPNGRTNFVEAVVEGLLTQVPSAVERCFDFLDELAITEKQLGLWADVMLQIAYLVGGHGQRYTKLFTTLVANVPRFLSCPSTSFAWAHVTGFTTPQIDEQAWFENILGKDIPYFRQLSGELIFLNCANTGNEWSKKYVAKGIRGELGDYFLRGMVFGAAAHISVPRIHVLAEEILSAGLKSENGKVVGAAWTLCNHISAAGWGDSCKRLVLQLIDGENPLSHDMSVLCHQLEEIVAVDPETCLSVCEKIVGRFATRLTDNSYSLSSAAEDIINISLTVQRFVPLRERGLVLFETLLELNVTEAKKAADLLNDRLGMKTSGQEQK
jgi:hypothetical protein